MSRETQKETPVLTEEKGNTAPEINVKDISILYQLSQQALIKVAEIDTVKTTLDKCKILLGL